MTWALVQYCFGNTHASVRLCVARRDDSSSVVYRRFMCSFHTSCEVFLAPIARELVLSKLRSGVEQLRLPLFGTSTLRLPSARRDLFAYHSFGICRVYYWCSWHTKVTVKLVTVRRESPKRKPLTPHPTRAAWECIPMQGKTSLRHQSFKVWYHEFLSTSSHRGSLISIWRRITLASRRTRLSISKLLRKIYH